MLNSLTMIKLILTILALAATYRLFEKLGMEPWKGLIPVYNTWCLFRKLWEGKYFFISFGAIILALASFGLSISHVVASSLLLGGLLSLIIVACITTVIGINLTLAVRLSRAFGHGHGYTAGYLFLKPIFIMILGFGNSEYLGA